MESLMEKVLYEGAVEFNSRTYGADASLTEMLSKPWKPANDFGLGGGGIARRMDDLPLIERYRYDDSHDDPHINHEIAVETPGRSRPLLTKHGKIIDDVDY